LIVKILTAKATLRVQVVVLAAKAAELLDPAKASVADKLMGVTAMTSAFSTEIAVLTFVTFADFTASQRAAAPTHVLKVWALRDVVQGTY
jgi:hypothetical protein